MEVFAIRLRPNKDLKAELASWVKSHKIQAGCILTCVGSLQKATLRMANEKNQDVFNEKFEIVSLVGTLSPSGLHLHISLSDRQGNVIGGHLKEGCLIYTTAEIVIAVFPNMKFLREFDETTGFDELVVQ